MNITRDSFWYSVRRFFGHRHDTRFTWGEVAPHKRMQIGLLYSPAGCSEHNTLILHLLFVSFYIHLPTKKHGDGCMRGDEPDYGFYTIDNCIVFRWGPMRDRKDVEAGKGLKGYWSFGWPWFTMHFVSNEILSLDRQRSLYIRRPRQESDCAKEREIVALNSELHAYRYTLRSGEVQVRNATIHVTRWTYARKWFPFVKHVNTSIDIVFDQEVGETSGSWKGGCTGCSYAMLDDESPVETLRRMERERVFK